MGVQHIQNFGENLINALVLGVITNEINGHRFINGISRCLGSGW